MYVVKPVVIETMIEGIPVAIQFSGQFMQLEPDKKDQHVTTCYLRPLDGGPKRVMVGTAVCHPNDLADGDYGKKLALARAIGAVWSSSPEWTYKQAWYLARRTIRAWREDQKRLEMLEAVQQELGRLDAQNSGGSTPSTPTGVMEEKAQELEAAGSRLAAERLGTTGLPAGPVSQFLSK